MSLKSLSEQFKIPLADFYQELQNTCGDVTPRNIALKVLDLIGKNRKSIIRIVPTIAGGQIRIICSLDIIGVIR